MCPSLTAGASAKRWKHWSCFECCSSPRHDNIQTDVIMIHKGMNLGYDILNSPRKRNQRFVGVIPLENGSCTQTAEPQSPLCFLSDVATSWFCGTKMGQSKVSPQYAVSLWKLCIYIDLFFLTEEANYKIIFQSLQISVWTLGCWSFSTFSTVESLMHSSVGISCLQKGFI